MASHVSYSIWPLVGLGASMKIDQVQIEAVTHVWVAWTNTDRTEGRGWQVPLHVAESPETAARLGHKGSVMGCDCEVTKEIAVRVDGKWLVPGRIAPESREDVAAREKREARETAIAKARAAGLSDADIASLVSA